MAGSQALSVAMHVDDEAGVENPRRLIRWHPQDWHAMAIFTKQRAYAMQGVRFVRRHAFMAAAAVGCAIAAAATDEVQEMLGFGSGEVEASLVGGTDRVGHNVKRFCQVWAKYQRVHGQEDDKGRRLRARSM